MRNFLATILATTIGGIGSVVELVRGMASLQSAWEGAASVVASALPGMSQELVSVLLVTTVLMVVWLLACSGCACGGAGSSANRAYSRLEEGRARGGSPGKPGSPQRQQSLLRSPEQAAKIEQKKEAVREEAKSSGKSPAMTAQAIADAATEADRMSAVQRIKEHNKMMRAYREQENGFMSDPSKKPQHCQIKDALPEALKTPTVLSGNSTPASGGRVVAPGGSSALQASCNSYPYATELQEIEKRGGKRSTWWLGWSSKRGGAPAAAGPGAAPPKPPK